MKSAWFVLIVSAFTDFGVAAAMAISGAMMATGKPEIPNNAVLLLAALGGMTAALRTVQQALKATPETAAALRGDQSTVVTSSVVNTP